jgi:hypothetical protein
MDKPELKQFGDLTRDDFVRHPVWIGCHSADHDEPWYEDTDEETFRPWTGELPADASAGMLLVMATLELRDGSRHVGFVTPDPDEGGLGTIQPQIFAGHQRFGFWGGRRGIPAEQRQDLYFALQKTPAKIFPLRYSVDPALVTRTVTGQVDGFYRKTAQGPQVEI